MPRSKNLKSDGVKQKDIERTLRQAVAFLEKNDLRYAVIGGIAIQFLGKPRFTYDVDFKVLVPNIDYAAARAIIRAKFPDRARPHIPADPLVVDVQIEKIPVDFLLALPGYEENIITRATRRKFGGLMVWICSAEDLLIQKVVANRAKDWLDVEGILSEQYGRLDEDYIEEWLPQFADLLERPEMLTQYREIQDRIKAIVRRHRKARR
ncbi:MAG: nucleotidyltransferase [Chloroflexi bacterium]|nr:nucleotidyltransferase [Chloroflexota bacterium]